MKTRIQVDGVWYVREDQNENSIDDKDLTNFVGCTYENDEYCWEATMIYNDEGNLYPGVDIKFTDKRIKPWKEEHWDNDEWFVGILTGNKDSAFGALKSMDEDGIIVFKQFLKKLVEKGWLKI
jgi:hypothetical protein